MKTSAASWPICLQERARTVLFDVGYRMFFEIPKHRNKGKKKNLRDLNYLVCTEIFIPIYTHNMMLLCQQSHGTFLREAGDILFIHTCRCCLAVVTGMIDSKGYRVTRR